MLRLIWNPYLFLLIGILKKTKDDLDMTTVDGNKTTAETLFQSPEVRLPSAALEEERQLEQ